MAAQRMDTSSCSSHLHIDELVETNRALHAAVLELQGLLRNSSQPSFSREQLQTLPAAPIQPVSHLAGNHPTKKEETTVSTAEVTDDALVHRITMRQSFEEENELARQRYVERRNAEMLRLKHWIDYKCKSCRSLSKS